MESALQGYFHEGSFVDKNGSLKTIKLPVLQEFFRQAIKDLPQGYNTVTPDPSLSLATQEPMVVPVIDVKNLLLSSDPKARVEELNKLSCAAKEYGIFLVKNHGIKVSLMDAVKNVGKGFFDLSFEEKKASVGTNMNKDNMGYGRNFKEIDDLKMADWLDRLTMTVTPKEASEGVNVWPKNPSDFKTIMEEYVDEGRKVCDELLKALAEALGVNREAFFQYDVEQTNIVLKLNYYPPCPAPALALPAHSDGTKLTFLMQCGATNGLQAYTNNKWGTIVWSENDLLVNVGDLVEIMSNGIYKSAWHRVITNLEQERLSVGLFYRAPPTAVIQPVVEVDGGQFKKVVVNEYLLELYGSRSVHTFKPALEFAK